MFLIKDLFESGVVKNFIVPYFMIDDLDKKKLPLHIKKLFKILWIGKKDTYNWKYLFYPEFILLINFI